MKNQLSMQNSIYRHILSPGRDILAGGQVRGGLGGRSPPSVMVAGGQGRGLGAEPPVLLNLLHQPYLQIHLHDRVQASIRSTLA